MAARIAREVRDRACRVLRSIEWVMVLIILDLVPRKEKLIELCGMKVGWRNKGARSYG